MSRYTKEELEDALGAVTSMIGRCEKMEGKFAEGTSQHSLLKNRIKALQISEILIVGKLEHLSEPAGQNIKARYTREDLTKALPPVTSIIHKCAKAQEKYPKGTATYNRFAKMIRPMQVAEALIEAALSAETSL